MEKTMRIVLVALFLLGSVAVQAGAQTMATYSWQPPVVTDASVITSYSIHYTKLYEKLPRFFSIRPRLYRA